MQGDVSEVTEGVTEERAGVVEGGLLLLLLLTNLKINSLSSVIGDLSREHCYYCC